VLLAYADAGLKLHPVPSMKEREYDKLIAWITAEAEKDRKANLASTQATDQVIVADETRETATVVVVEAAGIARASATASDPTHAANESRDVGERDAQSALGEPPSDPAAFFEPVNASAHQTKDAPGAEPQKENRSVDDHVIECPPVFSEAATLTIAGAGSEAETSRSDKGDVSGTETESAKFNLEEEPAEGPQYRWEAVPGRFPPVMRKVLVKAGV
jgi:hypothetical protein